MALHHSAVNGSYGVFSFFADIGIDIYIKTNEGLDCLQTAAFHRHLNLCKKLIGKYKFDPHITDNSGRTVLQYSVKNGKYDVFSFFAGIGIDIYIKSNNGLNGLHIAACYRRLNLCKSLINNHIFDLHMADIDGYTAINYTVKRGSYELVTYFADSGINIYLKTNKGINYLHIAACYVNLNLCKTLLEKHNFDVHMADNEGRAALYFSAGNGSYELLTYFLI